jgi:hypothetical protein
LTAINAAVRAEIEAILDREKDQGILSGYTIERVTQRPDGVWIVDVFRNLNHVVVDIAIDALHTEEACSK